MESTPCLVPTCHFVSAYVFIQTSLLGKGLSPGNEESLGMIDILLSGFFINYSGRFEWLLPSIIPEQERGFCAASSTDRLSWSLSFSTLTSKINLDVSRVFNEHDTILSSYYLVLVPCLFFLSFFYVIHTILTKSTLMHSCVPPRLYFI